MPCDDCSRSETCPPCVLGDHNHPVHELTPEEMEVARQAKCARCQAVVVDEPSKVGTVMVNYYIPAFGVRERVYLCGACGLGFGEYLNPAKLSDPMYQAVKAELQSRWT